MSVPNIIVNKNGTKETRVDDSLSVELLDKWYILVNKFQKFIEENLEYDPPKRYIPQKINKIFYRKGKAHAKASIFVEADTAVLDSSIKDYTRLAKSSPNTLTKEFRWYLEVLPYDIKDVFDDLLKYITDRYDVHVCSIHLKDVNKLNCLPSSVIQHSSNDTIQVELLPFNVDAYKRRNIGGIYREIPFCGTLMRLCTEMIDGLKYDFNILKVSRICYNKKSYGGCLKLICSPKEGVEYEIKWLLSKMPTKYIDKLNELLSKCSDEFGREVVSLNINMFSEDWSIAVSKKDSYVGIEVL